MLAAQLQPQPTHIYHQNNMSRITTTPGWDEQIVPTLKKRLESESQYLTKRLSAASFEDQHQQPATAVSSSSSSKLNSFPQSPTFGVFQQNPPGSSSSSGIPRSRTKSGPFLNDTRQLNGNNGGQSNGKRPSPRIDTSSISSPKIPSAALPSRIPTRPRSKSQLASSSSRPIPVHSDSQPPPLPTASTERSISGIPVLTTRSRSRSPSKRLPSTKMSVAVMENRRESLELGLGGTRIKEGFIKNELPPFKMNPNEALRIAEKGHQLNDEESSNCRTSYDSSRMAERKRSISMKPNNLHPKPNGHMMERSGSSGSDRSARRNSRPSTSSAATGTRGYGISTSHTGLGLGMGQPSSSRLSNGRTTQRTGSSRSPINGSSSTAFNAPRSASLNLLSASPSMSMNGNGTPPSARLGVAAHFIPPESTYTPPKGTDWDDVVLPTVAKKLGINESEKEGGGALVGEGDLAVEWDKDGTPIRWVKRKVVSGGNGSARVGLGLGDSTGSQNSIQPNDITPTRTHAFSPSFEPSPDNPLQPRQRPSSASLRNRPSASSDTELTTLRTTNGQPVSLGQPIDRSSSPSRNNAYYPGGEPFPSQGVGVHRKTSSQNMSTSSPISGLGSNPALNRKPSTLKKQNHSTPTVSRQGSELSLRTRNASNVGRNNNSNNKFGPGPGSSQNGHGNGQMSIPGTTHRITDAIYENQLARREGRVNEKGGGAKARKDDDMHGKGCGCLIM
ncbi:hypothetical protein I204_05652 [Kwoniella mangroviensis CBS 8886]|nr:hypothetical protein I204_05652 [Kwoniella mangroviensis CBS 8886]